VIISALTSDFAAAFDRHQEASNILQEYEIIFHEDSIIILQNELDVLVTQTAMASFESHKVANFKMRFKQVRNSLGAEKLRCRVRMSIRYEEYLLNGHVFVTDFESTQLHSRLESQLTAAAAVIQCWEAGKRNLLNYVNSFLNINDICHTLGLHNGSGSDSDAATRLTEVKRTQNQNSTTLRMEDLDTTSAVSESPRSASDSGTEISVTDTPSDFRIAAQAREVLIGSPSWKESISDGGTVCKEATPQVRAERNDHDSVLR
jgi:hypothetical protein